MNRIQVTDDLIKIIVKLSEGNPGAMQCLTELARSGQEYPLIFAAGVLMFNTLDLRGSSIYMLWNDCLYRSTEDLKEIILAWDEHIISSEEILSHVNAEGGRGIPFRSVPRKARLFE